MLAAVRRDRWRLGLLAAIVGFGALIVVMAVRQPRLAWAWMLLLLLYIPALVLATAVLKILVLTLQGQRWPRKTRGG